MARSLLTEHVVTLPELVRSIGDRYAIASQELFAGRSTARIRQLYLTGCGDSHHAALAAALAFRQLAGLPCQAATAMEFARYRAGFLDLERAGETLVIAISASGRVSRTVEALRLARMAGAQTVAITGNPDSPLASAAEGIFPATIPPGPGEKEGAVVPGARSYIASLLALYQAAVRLGLARGALGESGAGQLQEELTRTADKMEETISMSGHIASEAASAWRSGRRVVFNSAPMWRAACIGFATASLVLGGFFYKVSEHNKTITESLTSTELIEQLRRLSGTGADWRQIVTTPNLRHVDFAPAAQDLETDRVPFARLFLIPEKRQAVLVCQRLPIEKGEYTLVIEGASRVPAVPFMATPGLVQVPLDSIEIESLKSFEIRAPVTIEGAEPTVLLRASNL